MDVDGVVKFAQDQGLDEEDVAVLRKQKIDGSVLEDMTVDDFMKDGMGRGPAKKLMKALDKVFGRGECTRLRFFFVLVSLLLLCCQKLFFFNFVFNLSGNFEFFNMKSQIHFSKGIMDFQKQPVVYKNIYVKLNLKDTLFKIKLQLFIEYFTCK